MLIAGSGFLLIFIFGPVGLFSGMVVFWLREESSLGVFWTLVKIITTLVFIVSIFMTISGFILFFGG